MKNSQDNEIVKIEIYENGSMICHTHIDYDIFRYNIENKEPVVFNFILHDNQYILRIIRNKERDNNEFQGKH
jgi:hypothetical protein